MSQNSQQKNPSIGLGLISPEFLANPFPMFEQLRNSEVLYKTEIGSGRIMWFISRFEDAVFVLKDGRFSSQLPRASRAQSSYDPNSLQLEHTMLFMEGMDHTRLRTLVSRGFTPRFIESLRPDIENIAKDLLDAVQARGEMDLMSEFAFPLPINVISDMLGVPHQDRDKIRDWSAALADQMSMDPNRFEKLAVFAQYVRDLVEQKRQHPSGDLISSLIEKNEHGDQLSDPELLGMVGLLIFAGHETTSSLIGNGMLALLTHPEQIKRIQADLALIPSTIEELLRYCGPALSTVTRMVVEDVELGPNMLHKGDLVNVIVGSANRDITKFTDPEDLNVARQMERHLAFGHGIHYCLGAPLARLEGEIAFRALLTRLPDIRLNVDPKNLTWRGSLILRGLASLPVKF